MKKRLATAVIIGALMSSAGAAIAGTYQGEAVYDQNRWGVIWRNVSPTCDVYSLSAKAKNMVATIDNVEININMYITNQSSNPSTNSVIFDNAPPGNLTKVTFNGQSSFTCDGHTFLLPGYSAPVPTLSQWAMIMLSSLLAGGAALIIHRRRTA